MKRFFKVVFLVITWAIISLLVEYLTHIITGEIFNKHDALIIFIAVCVGNLFAWIVEKLVFPKKFFTICFFASLNFMPMWAQGSNRLADFVKLDIPSVAIGTMLYKSKAAIGMARQRLYLKLTGEKGTAKDFNNFIQAF